MIEKGREDQLLRYSELDVAKITPMMQQYLREKQKHPDCFLFFRLGDFYELFFDDAIEVAQLLSLTLTRRDCGLTAKAPMCGVPHHSATSYIARLVDKGHKVAICEQLEDPAATKGLVERAVTKIITPGTVTDLDALDEKAYHYVVAIFALGTYFALAACDLSANRFITSEFIFAASAARLKDEILRLQAVEIVANQEFADTDVCQHLLAQLDVTFTVLADEHFAEQNIHNYASLPQNDNNSLWPRAAAALLSYIKQTQFALPTHLETIKPYKLAEYMTIDANSRKHLELTETMRERKRKGSLLWCLDRCKTSMGSRLLRQWLEQPLLDIELINKRQDAISLFIEQYILRAELRELFTGTYDLERLAGKLALGNATPRDLYSLGFILQKIQPIRTVLQDLSTQSVLKQLYDKLDPLEDIVQLLSTALQDNPPLSLKEGGIIRSAYSAEVDNLRLAASEGHNWILELEQRERESSGIRNLKIRYNRVFGYAIEISNSNKALVPEHYQRKQTLANSERFITPELKRIEESISGAEQKLLHLEFELFCQLRETVSQVLPVLKNNAQALATFDVLTALAELAERENYCRPQLSNDSTLHIVQGRHPVVEKMLTAESFVPNDLSLGQAKQRLMLLTGPNMSGKSTYMRQNALIIIMAQIGAYVPATSALIGICDQIFTRVGASDDLAAGQSTFMVEMSEVATIMKQASPQSFLILDEIGRGTSTWDGLSIAWSVIEHIADPKFLACRCLFATHYHELTDLAKSMPAVFNCCVEVKEEKNEIVFLHQIKAGASDESYGIEVARLAGVPASVVLRAKELLLTLEQNNKGKRLQLKKNARPLQGEVDLFSAARDLAEQNILLQTLTDLDLDMLRPLDALSLLNELKQSAERIRRK